MDTSELETEVASLEARLDDVEAEARDLEYQRDTYSDQCDDLQRQLEEALERATLAEGALRDFAEQARRLQLMTSDMPMRDRLDAIEALFTLALAHAQARS